MTNQQNTLDEWVDGVLEPYEFYPNIDGTPHQLKQAILQKFQEVEREARLNVASNAMAIALYWLEEDGRPKHLVQDLWDVTDISVLKHIEQKYIDEGKAHFATQLTPTSQGDSK